MGKLERLAINDEGFIFDPETGNSYTVNKTGLFIIKLLKEGKNEEEIVYLFYNLDKLFGLNLEQLSKKGRSYLFASLIDFLSYEDAKRVKDS